MSHEVFTCPSCKKQVRSEAMEEHFASKHEKGVVDASTIAQEYPQMPPQQYPPQYQESQYSQRPEQQKPRRWQEAPPMPQTWPHGNLPQRPVTRDLVWYQQILGMWHYYRKGLAYWTVIVMFLSLVFLTEPWKYWR